MSKTNNHLFKTFITSVFLIQIIDLIIEIFNNSFNLIEISSFFTLVLILLAIVIALIQKNYFVALIVSLVKVVLSLIDKDLSILINIQSNFFLDLVFYTALLSIFILALGVYLIHIFLKNKSYITESPELQNLIWPFIVLLFYSIFDSMDHGIIIAITELIALIFVAHISESLLWISAFIYIPFNLINGIINDIQLTRIVMAEWVLGFIILGFAIYSLIENIKHLKHHPNLE
ncbi:MAG: hypothetical protein WC907_00810 [Acholeplasmataceae bacterium]